ncbi:hypothetical protein PMZ80_003987 [Knufia obscura]|uniref:H-type lectin domain-containing protein n=1 Tax=Knufia obscura TaxID=1635080 RepID=A0ABR0RRH0_9EURO|nr:hypothetical protein PMZ80_003987 [Knufia obscura]
MSLSLAPYNNAMRLGQGFNSYTQQICVDDAVIVDPERAENVVTNDGTTMRIMAQLSAKPSVWNRQKEVVSDEGVRDVLSTIKHETLASTADLPSETTLPGQTVPLAKASALTHHDQGLETSKTTDTERSDGSAKTADIDPSTTHATTTEHLSVGIDAADAAIPSSSDEGSTVMVEPPKANAESTAKLDMTVSTDRLGQSGQTKESAGMSDSTADKIESASDKHKNVQGNAMQKLSAMKRLSGKPSTTTSSAPHALPAKTSKETVPISDRNAAWEAEQKRLDEEEERARLREQRLIRQQIEKEDRDEERTRRLEERTEQRKIREEERQWQVKRREEARKAVEDAAKAKGQALTLDDLAKIKAQNQFAERFSGISEDKDKYTYDPSAPKGPSQTVVYSSKFIDRLSDITDDMSISGALSIKAAKIGGSGRGSFVDSDKFKDSDLKFYISVKVVNQTLNFKDALVYHPLKNVEGADFNKVYGDSFISGFIEGGEFNALVTMKVLNKAKMTDIQAEAKVALTAGPVDITAEANVGIARSNLETNTETTIQVSWCGGGHIKPMEQPWTIESIMQAASRFPDLVAECPQRTYAILTKYDSLRSFVALKPKAYTKLQYENAQIYTNALMDAFMTYKSLYKKLGEQMVSIQNKMLEIVQWDQDSAQSLSHSTDAGPPDSAHDTRRFDASLKGLSDARTAVRRQMMYIVNEVDLIEGDPTIATDEKHQEPFQAPAAFEARVPEIKIPDRLQRKDLPLSGKRFIAKTQTQEEFNTQATAEEQSDQTKVYSASDELSQAERSALDKISLENPGLGSVLRVSPAVGTPDKGEAFNNLDVLQPDWRVTTIKAEVFRGAVTYVEVEYDNGLLLRKGLTIPKARTIILSNFQPGERIVSAALECGNDQKGNNGSRLTAVRLYTNWGRRMLVQASSNEVKGDMVEKDGITYEQIKTLHIDNPLLDGSFKGFFGNIDVENQGAGIQRLGLIWGSVRSEKPPPTAKMAKPFDYEAPSDDSEKEKARNDLAQKEKEITALRETVNENTDALKAKEQELTSQKARLEDLQRRVNDTDGPKQTTYAQWGTVDPKEWHVQSSSVPDDEIVTFATRYRDPPRVIAALQKLDQPTPREMALSMNIGSITNSGFRSTFMGRDNTDMYPPRMAWLSLPENDIQFETGFLDTMEIPHSEDKQHRQGRITNRFYFSRPYQNIPTIVAWFCNINLPNTWHSIQINTLNVKKEYFDLSVMAWEFPDRWFHGARVVWLAYDSAGKKGKVQSGRVEVWNKDRWKSETISLTVGFTRPPAVLVALAYLDVGNDRPVRLAADVHEITPTSFKLGCGDWDNDNNMYLTCWNWIAIE